MNTDCYIDQGYSHRMCEDYAVVGDNHVIISDGCSSSKHTDIGARILCLSAQEVLTKFFDESDGESFDYFFMRKLMMDKSLRIIQNLGLPTNCLDATLLMLFVRGDKVYIAIYGDGYVAITLKSGQQIFWKFDFPQNAPYYPSYCIYHWRDQMYKKEVGDTFTNSYVETGDMDVWKSFNKNPIDSENFHNLRINDVKNILVMTDGVSSFMGRSSGVAEPISDLDILSTLTNFKVMKGEFIRRRSNATMKRFKKANIDHFDDIAIGGINFE